jgi:hypothetical protein
MHRHKWTRWKQKGPDPWYNFHQYKDCTVCGKRKSKDVD